MESDYSSLPAGKRIQITISIKDAPPPSSAVNPPRFHNTFPGLYSLYMMVLAYLSELVFVKMKSEYENQSPFETHAVLMIISLVTLCMALASGILMYTERFLKSAMTDIQFTILEVISFFSGVLATISLLLVFSLPQNLNWIGYLVISVILLIIIVCYFSGCMRLFVHNEDTEARQNKIPINYSITLFPLPLTLVLFLPNNLNWVKFSVDALTIVIVVGYNIFAYIKSVKKKDALNSEKLIKVNQQDNGNIIPSVA